MRFANILWRDRTLEGSDLKMVNMGDTLQFMVIDYLYDQAAISREDVLKIQVSDLRDYQGEKLILPLNWSLFNPYYMEDDRIALSENIIPVFLGMTIESMFCKDEYFNEYNISYLKRFEPIGCRDESTALILGKYHISAYINGCMSAVLPKRTESEGQNKVFFVDVPREVQKYIPEELYQNYEMLTQQKYYECEIPAETIFDDVKKQYYKFASEARLIVTSRLHVASPCMAMGIPIIFTKNQIDKRFGWLDQYLPIYDKSTYSKIDWHPISVEYENDKALIRENAIGRIKAKYEEYSMAEKIDSIFKSRSRKNYIGFRQACFAGLERAYSFIASRHQREDIFTYSIWGLNHAAEAFYTYMCEKFPNAKLKDVIDQYKNVEFHGVRTIKPELFEREKDEIIFVLPVKASNEAEHFFEKKGIDREQYICCEDVFLQM